MDSLLSIGHCHRDPWTYEVRLKSQCLTTDQIRADGATVWELSTLAGRRRRPSRPVGPGAGAPMELYRDTGVCETVERALPPEHQAQGLLQPTGPWL